MLSLNHGRIESLSHHEVVSEWRTCRVMRLNRRMFRYQSRKDLRTKLRMRIREIAQARVRELGVSAHA